MRILYGAAPERLYHARRFQAELERNGVRCGVVLASDIVRGFPSRNVSSWFSNTRRFRRLAAEFKPDIVMSEVVTNFALTAIKQGMPLLLYLRGDYWTEAAEARRRVKPLVKRAAFDYRNRTANRCFGGAGMVLPISKYLEGIVKSRFPDKPTRVFFNGFDPAEWKKVSASRLV